MPSLAKSLTAGNVVITGLEEIQNAGESRMINLIKAKIQAGMATAKNALGSALFNSNTEFGGKAIGGMQFASVLCVSAPEPITPM